MKSLLRRYCLLACLLLYWHPAVQAQTSLPVQKVEIRHVGPAAVADELIHANVRVKAGDTYSRASIDNDVRNLYATGYFYNIQVTEERSDAGVTIVYVVQGKPLLTDIKFEGNNKLSTSKLRKKVTSKTGEPLDERKLFTDSQEILKLYQKSGYHKTDVKYVPNINPENGRGTATFEITEAPKTKIVDISFVGAEAFSERKLAHELKTRKRGIFSWITGKGVLKTDQFEDDKEKLADFYRGQGYIDFEIKDIKFNQEDPKRISIEFTIFEGKQYKVGKIEIKGNSTFQTDEFLKDLKMKAGELFTPDGLNKDIEVVQDFYGSRGYVEARVLAIKSPNTETGTMDLVYQIEENNKSFLEKIEIKGNTKTKDKVIRRELAVTPGEVFDMTSVKLSKQRLQGLNYFERVDTQVEPTDVPNRKNLVVGVDEKSTGNFSIGAGFSSVDSVVGFVEVSQGNFDLFKPPTFTGGGQKFRLRTQIGTERQDYQLSFVEPWFFERKLAFGVDLYHRDLNFLSDIYDETRTGIKLSLTKALWTDFLIGNVSYTFERVGLNVNDPFASLEIQNEDGTRTVSKIGAGLAYDTRNSTQLPTSGGRTELTTEVAGFGGNTEFWKVELRSAYYFRGFFDGHLLEVNGRVGVMDGFGSTPRPPLFDRFFLGGLYSLRGYDFREVGPKDIDGEPVGGNTYWFGSVEYSIPIVERLRFALFYDIGMVYEDALSFNEGTRNTGFYNDNWGIGFRLNLPIGPLRIDYGIPLTSDERNGGSGKFQFGVGYTREF